MLFHFFILYAYGVEMVMMICCWMKQKLIRADLNDKIERFNIQDFESNDKSPVYVLTADDMRRERVDW